MFLQGLVYWTLLCKKTSYGCNPMMSTASLYKCFFTPLFLLGINFVLLLLLKLTSVLFPHRSFSNLNALSVKLHFVNDTVFKQQQSNTHCLAGDSNVNFCRVRDRP